MLNFNKITIENKISWHTLRNYLFLFTISEIIDHKSNKFEF